MDVLHSIGFIQANNWFKVDCNKNARKTLTLVQYIYKMFYKYIKRWLLYKRFIVRNIVEFITARSIKVIKKTYFLFQFDVITTLTTHLIVSVFSK